MSWKLNPLGRETFQASRQLEMIHCGWLASLVPWTDVASQDKLWSIQGEDVAEVWFFILKLNKSQTYLDIVVRCKGSFLRSLAASTGAGFDHAS